MTSTISFPLTLSGIALTCLLLGSCGARHEEITEHEQKQKQNTAASVKAPEDSNSKTVAVKADSGRSFVRTADLHFKVKDVKQATFDIERIVRENRGYVTNTDLESTVNSRSAVRVSADSVRETTRYQVRTIMTIRIPNTELDQTLSDIAGLFDYLDHRRVHSEDITRELRLASLSQTNHSHHQQRLEKLIDEKGKKLNQTLEAENRLFEKQAVANQLQVSTQELHYDMVYSTISISIYQNESQHSDMLAYTQSVKPYEPPFSSRFADAASTGMNILSEILLFIVRIWPLWLIGAAVWLAAKRMARLKWFNGGI